MKFGYRVSVIAKDNPNQSIPFGEFYFDVPLTESNILDLEYRERSGKTNTLNSCRVKTVRLRGSHSPLGDTRSVAVVLSDIVQAELFRIIGDKK